MRQKILSLVLSLVFPRSGAMLAGTVGSRFHGSTRQFVSMMSLALQQEACSVVDDILFRIREVNNMPTEIRSSLLEFHVDGRLVGKVRPDMAEKLCSKTNSKGKQVFQLQTFPDRSNPILVLNPEGSGSNAITRTDAVGQVMEQLRDHDKLIEGWRNELYPIAYSFYDAPVFLMERAAVPYLGGLEYGVHINGLVRDTNLPTKMWMARRSKTKSKYPGMLDHIVAGGQPAGLSLQGNVLKECMEEAGIPDSITMAGLCAVGAVSYETYSPNKDIVSRAVLFNYDLYLPSDFEPVAVDGEVDEFFLWSIEEILQSMKREYHDPIKPNCYVVIIDFLVRHGYILPDTPGYLDVVRELRSGDCR